MHLLKREKRCNAFSGSTDIIQVFNELPTNKRHIKVPQERLHALRKLTIRKYRFSKKGAWNVLPTRRQWSPFDICFMFSRLMSASLHYL